MRGRPARISSRCHAAEGSKGASTPSIQALGAIASKRRDSPRSSKRPGTLTKEHSPKRRESSLFASISHFASAPPSGSARRRAPAIALRIDSQDPDIPKMPKTSSCSMRTSALRMNIRKRASSRSTNQRSQIIEYALFFASTSRRNRASTLPLGEHQAARRERFGSTWAISALSCPCSQSRASPPPIRRMANSSSSTTKGRSRSSQGGCCSEGFISCRIPCRKYRSMPMTHRGIVFLCKFLARLPLNRRSPHRRHRLRHRRGPSDIRDCISESSG